MSPLEMKGDNYRTPRDFYRVLDIEFHFDDYDPCPENPEGLRELDGLAETPESVRCYYMNPPYSDCEPWLEKARRDQRRGVTVVCLVKDDHSTQWYRNQVMGWAEERPVIGRLAFGKNHNNFPSLVLVYRGFQLAPSLGGIRTVYVNSQDKKPGSIGGKS